LATRKAIRPQDMIGEAFIAATKAVPALKVVIDDKAARSGIRLKPEYEAENSRPSLPIWAGRHIDNPGLSPIRAPSGRASRHALPPGEG
jgi:hypothetical protein